MIDQKTGLPSAADLPPSLAAVNKFTMKAMAWFNGFAHVVLGLALGVSVLFFVWLFFSEIVDAFGHDNLAHAFLHALGTLMLLWTVSALITAEIRYMKGHSLKPDTFVEVAIIVILRKLITMPVQSVLPSAQEFMLWVGSAVLLGIMYLIVRYALSIKVPD